MAKWRSGNRAALGFCLRVAMALPADVRAQNMTAALRAKVTDQQGAALPDVTVTVRQVDTKTSLSVVSNGSCFERGALLNWMRPANRRLRTSGRSAQK